MATIREYSGGFFAECPDCGGRRYDTGATETNRHGQGSIVFRCDGPDCEELWSLDIDVEHNEAWTVETDETGRPALWISQFDETETADDGETAEVLVSRLTAVGIPAVMENTGGGVYAVVVRLDEWAEVVVASPDGENVYVSRMPVDVWHGDNAEHDAGDYPTVTVPVSDAVASVRHHIAR